jgi:carboxyl-terminal processing protease
MIRLMKRSWKTTALVLFVLALLGGGLFGERVLALGDDARDTLRLYTDLVTVAHDHYGADVSYRDLVYASIQGMLRTLDPHTSFLPPRAYSGMRERQQSSFYGLGILVGVRDGQLTVISPIEGTPASRLGMRAGDVISTIEGEPTETMSLDEAVDKLKGPKGTEVHITLVRRGLDEPLALAVTRDEIPQTTVRLAYMIDPTTGYIQISDFGRGTGDEVEQAIRQLKDRGMQRLILDLRNNGGGLLDQAIEVADQFVPKKSQIVETRGRTRDSDQVFRSSGGSPPLDLPTVVLVNRGTASAAEIVSGAIQDHDVGMVVGTPTWDGWVWAMSSCGGRRSVIRPGC